MCLRIDSVNVGSMRTSHTYRYSFPKPFIRKKNKVDVALLLLFLLLLIFFHLSEFCSGKKGLLLPGFSVLCLHLLAGLQSCTPMRLMRALFHWPCSRSWRSETNAELASVRAVNRMSPMCNIAARITNRFSTSYAFYKDRKHIELLRRKMKRQIL